MATQVNPECTVDSLIIEPMTTAAGVTFADRCYVLFGKPVVVAQLFFANTPGEGAIYWRCDVSPRLRKAVEAAARRILSRREEIRVPPSIRINDIHYLAAHYREWV